MARRFDPKDLARWLDSLSLLDGRLVATRQGSLLIWPRHVIDPRPLVDLGDQLPSREALVRAIAMRRDPVELDARRLGLIQRNIKRLRPREAQVAVAEAHRVLRRHGPIDDARLDQRQAQLDDLSARWQRGAEPTDVIRALIGPDRTDRVERLIARWRHQPRRALRRGRLRLERIVAAVRAGRHAIVELERLPGRARLRRLRRSVASELGIGQHGAPPEPPAGWRSDLDLADQVRRVGEQLLAERHRQLVDADLGRRGARVVRGYALMFELDAEATRRFADPNAFHLARRRLPAAIEHLAGTGLTCSQALALLAVPKLPEPHLRSVAGWLTEGIPIALLPRLTKRGRLHQMKQLSAEQRAAYAHWTVQLAEHYAAHGLDVELEPDDFGELAEAYGARRAARDMALVARCLIHHHQRGDRAVSQLVSLLDSTLALFRGLPRSLREVVSAIDRCETGLGRATHPTFAAWLDDDERLDRYLSLQRLVEGHTRLSKRARQDFVRGEGARSPSKTRRWMSRRADDLAARAYDQQLDAVIARLVEERFGVGALDVDESWRNAVRMQLLGGRNQEWLTELLACVARGGDRADLPANAAWLASKREIFDVDAWLRAHDERVDIAGQTHRLHTEERPLEVLPMGIPFDTCLSLHGGMNASSAILNAIDVNKRVIYLRSSSGTIVARKLVAVSRDHALVGFRIYSALPAETRLAVEAAVDGLAARIAEQAGLPLGLGGAVERLHDGFWYDDGTVAFSVGARSADGDDLTEYAERLGRPLPSPVSPQLAEEARIFAAGRRGAIADLGHLHERGLLAEHLFASWRERGSPEALLAAAEQDPALARVTFRSLRRQAGPVHALRSASPIAGDWVLGRELTDTLRSHPPSAELAEALVDVAEDLSRRAERLDDHGLAHDTFYVAARHLAVLPPARLLALAERLAVVWDHVIDDNPGCDDCRRVGEDGLARALLEAYRAQPDPDAVLRVLRAKRRRHSGTRRLALGVAARHVLDGGALEGCREVPGVRRLLTTVVARAPELEGEPVVLAAWLRHCRADGSGGLRNLPPVRDRPFEALGDLVDRFPDVVAEVAQPFASEAPRSGWETQHHRLHPTSYRRQLRQRRAAGQDVARELVVLGDVEGLTSPADRALAAAASVVRAHAERRDVASALAVWRQASHFGAPSLEHWLHPWAVGAAWSALEAVDEADEHELESFVVAATPARDLAERVDRLWPSPVALALARPALERLSPHACPIAPRTLVSMWSHERLRPALAQALGRCGTDELLEGILEASDDDDAVAALLAAWSAAERFEDDLRPLERDAEILARVAPILVGAHPPARWVPIYLELSDALGASGFLDAIATSSFSRVDALRTLGRREDPRQPHAAWLHDELEGHRS